MTDIIERRYLGALSCIDRATGYRLKRKLSIQSDQAHFQRNHSSLYVIQQAEGLERYGNSFELPDEPAPGSISMTVNVSDPLNQYLPRNLQINLPRDGNPDNRAQLDSLFNPVQVQLYAAPNASLLSNWSTVRVSVMQQRAESNNEPVAGALLRVIRNADDEVLSSGLSDLRGEALVIIPGIPITQFADETDFDDDTDEPSPVVVSETPARLEVSFTGNPEWPVNPDELETNHSSNVVASENLTLRTGRMEKLTIQLT
jgi:hypothetical protein